MAMLSNKSVVSAAGEVAPAPVVPARAAIVDEPMSAAAKSDEVDVSIAAQVVKTTKRSKVANSVLAHETAELRKTVLALGRSRLHLTRLEANALSLGGGKLPPGLKAYKSPQLGDAYTKLATGLPQEQLAVKPSLATLSYDVVRRDLYYNFLRDTIIVDAAVTRQRIGELQQTANLETFLEK